MSAQADQLCGAEYGERSAQRTNRRNGYRARDWDTRAGTVELAVPKLRHGTYFPDWLLTHRRRAEQALVTVGATAYLLGVSTRPSSGWPSNSGSRACRAPRSARWPVTWTLKSPRSAPARWMRAPTRSCGSRR